jgi:hypothetical protein
MAKLCNGFYFQKTWIKIWAVWMICSQLGAVYGYSAEKNAHLQIVSEVYKKQPYIQVPTAWIAPALRLQLLKNIQENMSPRWQVKEIPLKDEKDEWLLQLKCHPAANIEIATLEPKAQVCVLLLYPQSYRGLIEDPLAETPPPIAYLGSTQRVAFYYFSKHKFDKEVADKISDALKLKKT